MYTETIIHGGVLREVKDLTCVGQVVAVLPAHHRYPFDLPGEISHLNSPHKWMIIIWEDFM